MMYTTDKHVDCNRSGNCIFDGLQGNNVSPKMINLII